MLKQILISGQASIFLRLKIFMLILNYQVIKYCGGYWKTRHLKRHWRKQNLNSPSIETSFGELIYVLLKLQNIKPISASKAGITKKKKKYLNSYWIN